MVVSALHKKEVGVYSAEDQKQILTSYPWINNPGSVQKKFYGRDW